MKICSYTLRNSVLKTPRLGILLEETNTIVDPNLCLRLDYIRENAPNPIERADYNLNPSLSHILKYSDDPIETIEKGYALYLFFQKVGINELPDGTPISFTLDKEIKFEKPLDKIETYRDFYAHEKHVATGFKKRNEPVPEAWYEIPAYYKGAVNGFIGPEDEIVWPHYTDKLDYELELAVVLGKGGRNIKVGDANNHIFGYTILNDISARDIQKKEMAVRLGPAKGKDFCSVIGPVITTADEFDFKEPNLNMVAKINGKEWSNGQSGDSHYTFAQMIAHASMDEFLNAGDLIGSGTVGTGCGLELDKWIKEGDEVELIVEHIGSLKNKVGKKRKLNYGEL
tara:strand:+ start:197465 stop:198487 length:1023 start_codon:yes stop_codon:yes gene_type:complete